MGANSTKSQCQWELSPVSVNGSYFKCLKANRGIADINSSQVSTLVLEVPGLAK